MFRKALLFTAVLFWKTLLFFFAFSLLTVSCSEAPQALWFTFSGDWGSWRSPIELFEIDWSRFE